MAAHLNSARLPSRVLSVPFLPTVGVRFRF